MNDEKRIKELKKENIKLQLFIAYVSHYLTDDVRKEAWEYADYNLKEVLKDE